MELAITKEQYKLALSADGVLKDRSVELLNVMYDAPGCKATAQQLAAMLDYEDFPPVNALIGKLGKRIAQHLGIDLPEREGKSPGWWQIIAHGEYQANGFAWQLRYELFAALVELGLLQEVDAKLYPEVVVEADALFEGRKKTVSVNAFERNSVARSICIKHYGAKCCVCDFDFASRYGAIGDGFIHVHHVVEIASVGKEYKVDPVNDLRPVCPNCHAMLHQRRPAYGVEELRQLVATQRTGP